MFKWFFKFGLTMFFTQFKFSRSHWIIFLIWLGLSGSNGWGIDDRAIAQSIAIDGTLGQAVPLTGPIYIIPPQVGQSVGKNLFHSFGQFNLATGEVAVFQSTPEIRNILARVTGGIPSTIDGLIATESGNVNLFLMNPSGISFGPNASLNIGNATRGSFVATTLDAIVFPNGGQFRATNPGDASSLLTIVGDPSGFLAAQRLSQPITLTGSRLGVFGGQSLLLVGGDIILDNSLLGVYSGTGGRVELGGITGAGTIGLNANQPFLSLKFPDQVPQSDVLLKNASQLYLLSPENGGSLAVNARNIEIRDASLLAAGRDSGAGSLSSQAGDIVLNATGTIRIDASKIANVVNLNALGNGGNIQLTANSIFLSNGAQVQAGTLGQGNAGNVTITASKQVVADGFSSNTSTGISSFVFQEGRGQGGNIIITTDLFSFTNGAQLIASTSGQGDGGSVAINARDVSFDGGGTVFFTDGSRLDVVSGIFNDVNELGVGRGGDIRIDTKMLRLTNGSELSSSTYGRGNAGDVIINAGETVTIAGFKEAGDRTLSSGIFSNVQRGSQGNGGTVQITTDALLVANRAELDVGVFGQGNAGNVILDIRNIARFDNGNIFSNIEEGSGQGGDIRVNSGSLFLQNSAEFVSSTRGQGNAGNVIIKARDVVSLDGATINGPSGIVTNVRDEGIGQGGDIRIDSRSLLLTNGAELIASTFGQGDAGNILINAQDTVLFDGQSRDGFLSGAFSSVGTPGRGDGGDIAITTRALFLKNGALLSSSSTGQGVAGSVAVRANLIQLDRKAGIQAETALGNGGNIKLDVQDLLLLRRGSRISTSAGTALAGGDGGNITVNAKLVIAVPGENSDITANAFTGKGGRVDVTTQSLFGIQVRPRLTPLSDITASSESGVQGIVDITTPDIDPNRGLVQLPTGTIDPASRIAQSCAAGRTASASQFVATGRGGLPNSPDNALSNDVTVTRLAQTIPHPIPASSSPRTNSPPIAIAEAQGAVKLANGKIRLVAQGSDLVPYASQPTTTGCHLQRPTSTSAVSQ